MIDVVLVAAFAFHAHGSTLLVLGVALIVVVVIAFVARRIVQRRLGGPAMRDRD